MSKTAVNQALLQLLVRVYNQSIQSYYFFPDVIICGNQRLEREEFDLLLQESFLTAYHTDSFGKIYRLSRKAEELLYHERNVKKRKAVSSPAKAQCGVLFQ